MGLWKKVKKVVKKAVSVSTGGLLGSSSSSSADDAQKALEEQAAAEQQQLDQETNKQRQESSDLASLAEQSDVGGDMTGLLTSADGVTDRTKLAKKKALGG